MKTNTILDTELTIAPSKGLIQVVNLQKNYGSLTALQGISFEVYGGEIFGLIGPDGAGKTTTFHILSGIMEASGGYVDVLGKKPRHARLDIGYLTQQFSLYLDLSVQENLRYVAGLREVKAEIFRERRDQYLRLMNLESTGDRLAGQLSGGMKQKLALCCALISQPQILLLDEPTTGVDPVSRREFWDILASLAAQGMTIVVATPYLDEAERCNRIALMYEGRIEEMGTLNQLRSDLGLQRLELRTASIPATEKALLPLVGQGIVDVQTFGDRLDILAPLPEKAAMNVRQTLAQESIAISSLQVTEPTLENVFVIRLRQQASEPPFIPLPRIQSPQAQKHSGMAIMARDLRKSFGLFTAVKGVNLEVSYGEIYGLLGANGAGKTTTIKMLCGLLPATGGDMSLAGQRDNLRSRELRQRIGYMSQKFTLYDDLTVVENLEFYCGVYGVPSPYRRQKIDWVLETCGLIGQGKMLTGRLPGGWKQRVAFGASVIHEPEILFLDEPTSGVDPLARRQFYGFALNPEVHHLKLGVVDYAQTSTSRELISAFTENQIFDVTTSSLDEKMLTHQVETGKLTAGLIIAPEFSREIAQGEPTTIQVFIDGVDANTAGITNGYINQIVQQFALQQFNPDLQLPISTEVIFFYNPGLVSSWFFVPGVMGLVLTLIGSIVSSVTVVKEKDTGTLEQLLMTPAEAWEILLAKVIPLFIMLMGDVLLALTIGRVVFAVPFRGNFLLFMVLSGLYVFVSIGVGIMLATLCQSQQQVVLTTFFINLPMIQLSGALAPIETMPHFLQYLSLLNPLRHYIAIIRGILLKGVGLESLWIHVLALVGFAVVLLTVSAKRFRSQLR